VEDGVKTVQVRTADLRPVHATEEIEVREYQFKTSSQTTVWAQSRLVLSPYDSWESTGRTHTFTVNKRGK
jgi:hypothetical protein